MMEFEEFSRKMADLPFDEIGIVADLLVKKVLNADISKSMKESIILDITKNMEMPQLYSEIFKAWEEGHMGYIELEELLDKGLKFNVIPKSRIDLAREHSKKIYALADTLYECYLSIGDEDDGHIKIHDLDFYRMMKERRDER
jgi:hypothetical protein